MRIWYMVLTASGESVGFCEDKAEAIEAATELDGSAKASGPHQVVSLVKVGNV